VLLMDTSTAVTALSALAHTGRLDIFRLLVKAGDGGVPAGDIAKATGIVPQTLSGNLTILVHAGLISATRDGRSIRYAADYGSMRDLLGFLMEDCCGGSPEICAPLVEIAQRASCCAPGQSKQ
jgi:DNA-binding transcriptional ArsR family regulator